MAERRLTVSAVCEPRVGSGWKPDRRADRQVPFLRLRGRWLGELGFEAGVRVSVSTAPGRLVITPAAHSEVVEPVAGEG